jgi:hypothetical protein
MSLGSALSELELCDELIRERARRSDWPVEMVFDLRNNQILRVETLPKNKKEVRRVLMKLPQGVRIDRIKVADRSLGGEVRLACSSKGYMPSYAFALQAGTQRQWVLVPGIPGKFRKMQHESEVDDIFRTLAISGSDAR